MLEGASLHDRLQPELVETQETKCDVWRRLLACILIGVPTWFVVGSLVFWGGTDGYVRRRTIQAESITAGFGTRADIGSGVNVTPSAEIADRMDPWHASNGRSGPTAV